MHFSQITKKILKYLMTEREKIGLLQNQYFFAVINTNCIKTH